MTMNRILALAALGATLLAGPACTESRSDARATAVLVDVSGTYADRLPEVMRIVRLGLLPGIRPGDTLMIVRIGERSYSDEAMVKRVTLDVQPSRANAQKLALANALEGFAESQKRARFTDISGALLFASEHLKKTGAGKRAIVIFSDMREELPKGVRRKLEADELVGTDVFAMNVKRLAADVNDPAAYRARLDEWGTKLKEAGAARWTVVLDSEELAREFGQDL
jgi:hypothetical protein